MARKVAQPAGKETANVQPQQTAVAEGQRPKPQGREAALLNLQRTHGNRHVTQKLKGQMLKGGILQRQCSACGQEIAGGECVECGKTKGRLQRKLKIGATNDPLELEADRVADQVMAAPAHSIDGGTPLRIQRFTGQTDRQADMTAPASVDRVLPSPGRPLEPGLQQDMGQRFGHDFSQVRVHTGVAAERSAREVNANAYTVGHNIVFGAGQYVPASQGGRRLLAHELTHVLQQRPVSTPATARQALADHREGPKLSAGAAHLQRQPTFSVIPQTVEIAGEKFPPPTTLTYVELEKLIHKLIEIWRRNTLEQLRTEQVLASYVSEIDKISSRNLPKIPGFIIIKPLPLKVFQIQMHPGESEVSYPQIVRDRLIRVSQKQPPQSYATVTPVIPVSQEQVSQSYDTVKGDPLYIDNFTNDIKDAWYPNARVFVFRYPNDIALKIGLPDLLKALSISSELNPQPSEADLRKRYKIPEDLILPKSSSTTPFITVGRASFIRDKETGIIFPVGNNNQAYLPRIADAVKQIESTRITEELWQKAAPILLEVITNLEWGVPRGFGALLVSIGKGVKKAAKGAKALIKPGSTRPPTRTPPSHISKDVTEAVPTTPIKPSVASSTKLPEPTFTGKGHGREVPNAKVNALDDITDDTKLMFQGKPEIKKALEGSPRAARALKKCNSPCFPDHISPSQVDRLERLLEAAEDSGIYYTEKQLTDFLRSKKSWKEFEDGLDDLDKSLLRAREVHGELGLAGKQIGGDRFTPEGRPATTAARAQPGTVTGGNDLPEINGQWFSEIRDAAKETGVKGTKDIRIAQIPGQIAKKIRNMSFKNFDDFREIFWKMVAADPILKQGWSARNLKRMQDGLAPRVPSSQKTGGGANAVYQINHKQAIKNAGDVYNLDNLEVVGPRFHAEIGD